MHSTIDTGGSEFDLSGVGIQRLQKTGTANGAATLSGALQYLSGSGGGMDMEAIAPSLSLMWENYASNGGDSVMALFYGFDLAYTYADVYGSGYEVETYTLLYGGTLGLQYNLHTADMIVSPFWMMKLLMGSYESDIYTSGSYSSASDDIDPILNQSFGFDIYFNSLGSTLSALLKNDDASQTLMLAYGWNW